ncbi:hypothetical protein PV326_001918, partial [Microctonus aethiopoides]
AEHQRQSSHRLYDPLQYSAKSNNAAVKRLDDENEPNKMNEDEMSWKNKYLHEIKLRTELQDQIDNLAAENFHLKQELEKLRGNKSYKKPIDDCKKQENFRPTDYERGSRPTSVSSDPCLITTRFQETNDHHSNVHQNGNNEKFSDNAV